MNELTRIINLQVTVIREDGKRRFSTKEKMAEKIAKIVEDGIGADDVTVISTQEFLWEDKKLHKAAVLTNADKIRNMSIEDLAAVIMCPYDTAGDPEDIMPCAKDGIQEMVSVEACRACCIAWLNRKAEVSDGKSNQ